MDFRSKFKLKIITTLNKIRLNFRTERTKRFFRLIIHERAKPWVKGIKYILTAVSLFGAFLTFSGPVYAFLFGGAIFLVLTFIENTFFIYNSLLIFPTLTFEYEPEKWLGCFFGYASGDGTPDIPILGLVVTDIEYGRKLHETLRGWTGGLLRDETGKVCLSAITLNEKDYVFFCYPNPESDEVEAFHSYVESERRKESLTDIHHPTFVMTILGKRCSYDGETYFPKFKERYTAGVPVRFQICVPNDSGEIRQIEGLDDFVFFNLNFKNKEELNRKDVEYDLIRIRA